MLHMKYHIATNVTYEIPHSHMKYHVALLPRKAFDSYLKPNQKL